MKPEQQSNYWQPDPAPVIPEQPTVAADSPAPVAQDGLPVEQPTAQPPYETPQETSDSVPAPVAPSDPVSWQASEYIHQEKDALWFTIFGVVVLGLMALAIVVMQAWSFAILIAVMAAAVIVYSHRPPRILNYTLSEKGLYVGERLYSFSEFKSFGVIRDGAEFSVMLVPVKRFSPGVTVYFPEEYGEKIVDLLGARLPMQELKLDVIDKVVRKLRL